MLENGLYFSEGSSSSFSTARSFVNKDGAGGYSSAIAVSPDGKISRDSAEVFTDGATSSSAKASASASTDKPPMTSATANAPASTDANSHQETTSSSTDSLPDATDANSPQENTSSSTDSLPDTTGDNTILGSAGDDYLRGGPGKDLLIGGGGDDTLVGDFGPDTLKGGAGVDLFIPRGKTTNPLLAHIIADFSAAEGDMIGIVANRFESRDLAFEAFYSAGDGMVDATLVKFGANALAVVLGTVDAWGQSTLTIGNFIPVQDSFLA